MGSGRKHRRPRRSVVEVAYCKKLGITPRRVYDAQREYGLTPGMLISMHLQQNSKCAICGDESKLSVDHDHRTGKVRQLLCSMCNRMLGMASDNIGILENAAAYLREHSGEEPKNYDVELTPEMVEAIDQYEEEENYDG